MKVRSVIAAAALAAFGTGALAATDVHAWDDTSYGLHSDNVILAPVNTWHIVTLTNPGGDGAAASFDEAWTFTLESPARLYAYAATWQVADTRVDDASFALYAGTPGSGALVLSGPVDNAGENFDTGDGGPLAAGEYYFELTGDYTSKYAFYEIDALQAVEAPPAAAVPEPGGAGLLAAGLAMTGWLARRRRRP